MSQQSIKLFPSQYKFVHSEKKEVLLSGSYGCGKSRALCYALVRQATIPGNDVLLLRKTLTSLRRSTLISLIGGSEPILARGTYTHNKLEQRIRLNGGGTIYYMGLDEATKIRSMNLGAIAVDEAIEITETEYNELLGRLRLLVGSRQIFMATNPGPPSHWIYQYFFIDPIEQREVIMARTEENTLLPDDYILSLKSLPPSLYRRYVEGIWCAIEGLVYDTFDTKVNIRSCEDEELSIKFEEYFLGIDFGYRSPTAMVLVGRTGEKLRVLDEVYARKLLMSQIKDHIKFYHNLYPDLTCIVDPSAATLIAEIENLDVYCLKADNDIILGINRVRTAFSDGLLISDKCVNLLRELENYIYEEGTEKPVKRDDHALDALRYVCNTISSADAGPRPFIWSYNDFLKMQHDEEVKRVAWRYHLLP
uniref:Putative terminase n=1 Tax=viral metagenome TaxID=1070528 RepID=A0A6M3KUG7_9ZZZZ